MSPASDTLHEVVAINNVRPVKRRARRRLLAVSGPLKRLCELSDSDIERWAGEIVDGMAEGIAHERSRTPRA